MTTIEQGRRWRFRRRSGTAVPLSCSLALQDVTFTDDQGRKLLDGATLNIESGSTTCVVGSDTEDQAAFLALILGITRPEQGNVIVDAHDLSTASIHEVRKNIALVLADPWLVEGTVADNIVFGLPKANMDDVRRVCELAGIDGFVRSLPKGFRTVIGGRGPGFTTISIGEKRRIATARALLRNPGVIVFEEPTTGLGLDESRIMTNVIDRATAGRTAVIATHRLSLARRADRVVVLDEGRFLDYAETGPSRHDHARLWDLRIPPVMVPELDAKSHLRIVKASERRAPQPQTNPWGIMIGKEMAPGYLASGLLDQNAANETWVAWSVEREEPVRVKVPRRDPVTYPAYEQLFREFRTVRDLGHPGVASTIGADLEAEMPYVVFEYLDSLSLESVIGQRAEGLDPLDVLYTGHELAGAISFLHQRNVAHLNLRARHVRTRHETVVITDFSHARMVGDRLPTHAGQFQCTTVTRRQSLQDRSLAPEYRPGEPVDLTMDIYALGALLHRATTGSIVASQERSDGELAPFLSFAESAPKAMGDIIDRMLLPDPTQRPDIDEVLSVFRQILPRSLMRPPVSITTARPPNLRLVGADN